MAKHKEMTLCGVAGDLLFEARDEALFDRQKWISEWRVAKPGYGKGAIIQAEVRFDDSCRNGHNTFAVTGTITTANRNSRGQDIIAGGCLHDEIAKAFPELAHLIRWHLCDADTGPMHGVANALYFAGDRDHNGLQAGERKPLKNRDGLPMWELVAVNNLGIHISGTETGLKYTGAETVPLFILEQRYSGDEPPPVPKLEWRRSERIGEGKPRDLDAARRAAAWPDATDEQLCAPREELKAALEARLPALLEEFRADVTAAGFAWSPADA